MHFGLFRQNKPLWRKYSLFCIVYALFWMVYSPPPKYTVMWFSHFVNWYCEPSIVYCIVSWVYCYIPRRNMYCGYIYVCLSVCGCVFFHSWRSLAVKPSSVFSLQRCLQSHTLTPSPHPSPLHSHTHIYTQNCTNPSQQPHTHTIQGQAGKETQFEPLWAGCEQCLV